MAELPNPRSAGSAATLNGSIYIVGGLTDESYLIKPLERFDPREGSWHSLAPMGTPRSYLGFVACGNNQLYAVGGRDQIPLSNAEVYDIRADRWRPIAELKTPRALHGLVSFNNQLVALGGEIGPKSTEDFDSVEFYDTAKGMGR